MKKRGIFLFCLIVVLIICLVLLRIRGSLTKSTPQPGNISILPTQTPLLNPHLVFTASTNEPGSLDRYFMYDLVTQSLAELLINHPFFKRPPNVQERSINDEYVLKLFGLQPTTDLFQIRNIKSSDGSYIVQTKTNTVITYWEFNPNTNQFSSLYVANDSGCNGGISGWDRANKKVFVLMKKPSLEDSSSEDISGVCIYDYATKKQIYRTDISMTKSNFYFRGATTTDMSRVVLEGNNNVLILDTTSAQNRKTLEGRTLYDSEQAVEKYGMIILINDQKKEYELSLYNVKTGELLKKVLFSKNVNGKSIDHIHLDDSTYDINNNLFYIEYVFYYPYTTCWFSFGESDELKKLTCSSDMYQTFYPGRKIDMFRTSLTGYFTNAK